MELIHAYIDPGSGSLVVQVLIAGLVAVPIFFRRQIARVIGTLRGKDQASDTQAGPDDSATGG